jgi:hypothetical protein
MMNQARNFFMAVYVWCKANNNSEASWSLNSRSQQPQTSSHFC